MVSLRSILPLIGVAVLAGVCVSGCSGRTGGGAVAAEGGQRALVLLGWRDYCSPALLERFERETGVKVDYQVFAEAEEVEGRLSSEPGSVDVLMVDSFNLDRLRQLRLLRALERERLPNFVHLGARFRDLGCDPGNAFSVPYHWGTTLIAYRKDRISTPEPSWRLLWDERYKGKLMMLRDSFEPMAATLILQGKRPDTLDGDAYNSAATELLEQMRRLEVRYGTDDQVKDGLLSGDVWAAMCYNGDAAFAADQDPRIDFFIPREGTTLWVDLVAVARDTKSPELAHRLVNYLLDPAVAAENASFVRYATPNETAIPLVDVELRNDPRIFPSAETLARCSFVPLLDRQRGTLMNRYWQLVQREFVEREQAVGRVGGAATSR